MASTTLNKKKRISRMIQQGIEPLANQLNRGFRLNGRSTEMSPYLVEMERLFKRGVILGLTESYDDLDKLRPDEDSIGVLLEGAAMGLAILDLLFPGKRWQRVLDGAGAPHSAAMHVGFGMALARLGRPFNSSMSGMDPLLKWLLVDGYGFHQGYCRFETFIERQRKPRPIRSDSFGSAVFDQGLGRSLWFTVRGNPVNIKDRIGTFDQERRADLWSGVGLACAHAGRPDTDTLRQLKFLAGRHQPHLALGAVLAATIREQASWNADHTEEACSILCDLSSQDAAKLGSVSRQRIPDDSKGPAYGEWRNLIVSNFQ